jgi:3-oxoacyl-[acyl-carrier-protein] synthase II
MIAINTACAASAHSIGEAFRRIQDGEARMMVAGGYDALTSYVDLLGFGLLGALTTDFNDAPAKASRPFDRSRSGFVIGEGAVVVILEELEAARRRGARIYAELAGYGSSMNAYRVTDSPPDGGGAISAIASAIRASGLPTEAIGYVVAHGTSTPGNDLSETVALKSVFGPHAYALSISSPKSMTGHMTAAAGALNVLVGAMAIQDQVVPPTINLDHPDPHLDLDYVPNVARRQPVDGVLVNAFAFGGTNASLVLHQAERAPDRAA